METMSFGCILDSFPQRASPKWGNDEPCFVHLTDQSVVCIYYQRKHSSQSRLPCRIIWPLARIMVWPVSTSHVPYQIRLSPLPAQF